MPKVRCLIMMTAAMAAIAALSAASMAANQQIGGGGLSFSCDVNTQRCECSGVETGADCQGMKKNCGSNRTYCITSTESPTGKAYCFCTMGRHVKVPGKLAPADKAKTLSP
jgi:hypothetical protein